MYPLIIQTIAAEHIREQHERAARMRTASEIRRRSRTAARLARAKQGRARGPLTLPSALGRAKA